jgi:hypothetical protein
LRVNFWPETFTKPDGEGAGIVDDGAEDVVVVGFEVVVETDVVFVVETLVDLEVVEALVVVAELGKHYDRMYLVRGDVGHTNVILPGCRTH